MLFYRMKLEQFDHLTQKLVLPYFVYYNGNFIDITCDCNWSVLDSIKNRHAHAISSDMNWTQFLLLLLLSSLLMSSVISIYASHWILIWPDDIWALRGIARKERRWGKKRTKIQFIWMLYNNSMHVQYFIERLLFDY